MTDIKSAVDSATGAEIAVVGMAGRFPGARNVGEFWRNVRDGVESVRTFTTEELVSAGESPETLADPDYVKARPILEDADCFDAGLFGFSPQDAAIMDPQHRVFLEVGWEALEDAGYDPSRFGGSVGVFATCGMNTYMMYHLVTNQHIMRTVGEWLVRHTGNDMNFLATRLSYELGLKGPSMNVQTACSSALVAIHLASQSLLNAECDMALAGGSVIVLPQDRGYLYKKGEILSPDGHCRAFDARAAGTLFGSGTGLVVLRRLADAIESGDRVLAVIRGSAVNNDGAMKVGYLAPSVEGQSRAIIEALSISGVNPETISYVEAHGTGTLVGDPIEVTALTEAYRHFTARKGFCGIGSLKSNIGHLGEAAGVAGFIKTVLSLQHRQLPPSLHFDMPNPQIDFGESPFFVNATLRPWDSPAGPRRAGITALGAGGTNCHVIVEEAADRPAPEATNRPQVLVLSAKTAGALARGSANLATALESDPELSLADAAYTLQIGRQGLTERRAVVCRSRPDAIARLRSGQGSVGTAREQAPPVAFLFPGGGAQYPDMARELYQSEPVYRRELDRCLEMLRATYDLDLRPLIFPADGMREAAATALEEPCQSSASVFITNHALAALWQSWGINPASMTGHSVGEYNAACVAGVFSLEDALRIVVTRGRIFERAPRGGMVSLSLPHAEVRALIDRRLDVAAVNAPSLTVVSGLVSDIDAFERLLLTKGVEAKRLHFRVAAHSAVLDPYLAAFAVELRRITFSPPAIPFISNLTGQWIRSDEATSPDYWVRHLRETVRFSDGLATLLASPDQVLLEVGPGRTLASFAKLQTVRPVAILHSVPHPGEAVGADIAIRESLARLWTAGAAPDWAGVHASERRHRVALPTYAFERERHWIDASPGAVASAAPPSALLDPQPLETWFQVPAWTRRPPMPTSAAAAGDLLIFGNDDALTKSLVTRLNAGGHRLKSDGDAVDILEVSTDDTSGVRIAHARRTAPGPDDVEIEVRTAALNFKDVLKVAGLLPNATFGMECAGVVTRVGARVTQFRSGDAVVALGPDSFRSHVIRNSGLVASKPESLSWAEASTLPAAFVTASYALETCAALRAGERILIHAASGGVGLAAVQIAQRIGAEIFATAGSPEKRAYLESLGVAHVLHSRSLAFAEDVQRRTGGAGVDVVLNSLTGEFIPRSLELVAQDGRFVELGITEIYDASRLAALTLRPGVRYLPIDLTQVWLNDPRAYGELLRAAIRRVASGEWGPLRSRVFPVSDANDAFGLMTRAQHIGKVVLSFEAPATRCHVVLPGTQFARAGDDSYTLNPAEPEDYVHLLQTLGPAAGRLRRIVHLWNVPPQRELSSESAGAGLERSFFSPLFLAQALGKQDVAQPIDVSLVSTGLHQVAGEGQIEPIKAALLGPCLVTPRELPNLTVRSVDISLPGDARAVARLVARLSREIEGASADLVVALRNDDRWVLDWQREQLPTAKRLPYRDGGTYVITGGFGGIGLALASHLATSARVRLALIGRHGLPARAEWSTWLGSHDGDDPTSTRIRAVQACETQGATVLAIEADVGKIDDMRRGVDQIRQQFGPINGVFHAAGHLDDGPLQLKDPEAALRVLMPKVHGTLILDELLADEPLDFVVLFSSVSSVLGLEGQVDYTAANGFLDAYARSKLTSGAPIVSINWSAWREHGLAAMAGRSRRKGGPQGDTVRTHPWLERKRRTGATTVYSLPTIGRTWVVGEHVVRGADAVLPGTGYLELIRAAFADLVPSHRIAMSRVTFESPFVARKGEDPEIEIALTPHDSAFDVQVRSRAGVHMTAGIAESSAASAPLPQEVLAIRARCHRQGRLRGAYLDQDFMAFGPRWGNVRRIDYGAREALLELSLDASLADDVTAIRLHPALMDMATGGAQQLIEGFSPAGDFYVPFTYERVTVWDAVPAHIFSHVRLREDSGPGTAMFDVTLLDPLGRVLVDVTGYCMRRVADGRALGRPLSNTASDTPREAGSSSHSIAEEMLSHGIISRDGLEALDRILDHSILPQVMVSPISPAYWQARLAQSRERPMPTVTPPTSPAATLPAAIVGDIEVQLAHIWADLLGAAPNHPDDNFFDLGGHSLLAVRLLTRIEKTFGRSLSLQFLFQSGTLADLAAALRTETGAASDDGPALVAVPRARLRAQSGAPRGRNHEPREK